MNLIDPAGMKARLSGCLVRRIYYSAGPNDQWCYDGHDKQSKYGLAIHGCVDAFTGKIMWLKVFISNHDPRVILKNYLECCIEFGGKKYETANKSVFPYNTRSDCGTETVMAASIQAGLHHVSLIYYN